MKNIFKKSWGFVRSKVGLDFWQRFARSLIVVVAVMPVSGLGIAIGRAINPATYMADFNLETAHFFLKFLSQTGNVIEQIGWAVIRNLHIMFAVAIGGSWAKNVAGGAFSALVGFLVLHTLIGALMPIFHPAAWKVPITESNSIKESIIGIQSLKGSGIFTGIIMGFVGGAAYNKFNTIRLPRIFNFFSGSRFVPFIMLALAVPIALLFSGIWIYIQRVIFRVGNHIASSSVPFAYTFLYGGLERILLPFGLHHMITQPMNFSDLGGSYLALFTSSVPGGNPAVPIIGHSNISDAWLGDMIKLSQKFGVNPYALKDVNPTELLARIGNDPTFNSAAKLNDVKFFLNFTPSKFITGQRVIAIGGMTGASLAIVLAVPKIRRSKYAPMLMGAAATAVLAGVTEPVEFTFIFISPPLLLLHGVLTGTAFGLAEVIGFSRIKGWGLVSQIAEFPQLIAAGMGYDILVFIALNLLFFVIYLVCFYYAIKLLKAPTPGHLSDTLAEGAEVIKSIGKRKKKSDDNFELKIPIDIDKMENILEGLGGIDNITDPKAITNCISRLRLEVNDINKVNEKILKGSGALGVVKLKNNVQVVIGTDVELYTISLIKLIAHIQSNSRTSLTDDKENKKDEKLEKEFNDKDRKEKNLEKPEKEFNDKDRKEKNLEKPEKVNKTNIKDKFNSLKDKVKEKSKGLKDKVKARTKSLKDKIIKK